VKNLKLDNKRLKFEIMKLQQEREKLAVETEVLILKKNYITFKIQAEYPQFLDIVSSLPSES